MTYHLVIDEAILNLHYIYKGHYLNNHVSKSKYNHIVVTGCSLSTGMEMNEHLLPEIKDHQHKKMLIWKWAKENSSRAIDSRMLSIWGSVLQLITGPEQLYAAIQLIRADVEALLNQDILGDEINDARYERRLGLQLFGDF